LDPFAESAMPAKERPPREESAPSRGTAPVPRSGTTDRLGELIHAEALIAAKGTTCRLKDEDWSSPRCMECPERGSHGALCMIGVAQQKVLREMGQ